MIVLLFCLDTFSIIIILNKYWVIFLHSVIFQKVMQQDIAKKYASVLSKETTVTEKIYTILMQLSKYTVKKKGNTKVITNFSFPAYQEVHFLLVGWLFLSSSRLIWEADQSSQWVFLHSQMKDSFLSKFSQKLNFIIRSLKKSEGTLLKF